MGREGRIHNGEKYTGRKKDKQKVGQKVGQLLEKRKHHSMHPSLVCGERWEEHFYIFSLPPSLSLTFCSSKQKHSGSKCHDSTASTTSDSDYNGGRRH